MTRKKESDTSLSPEELSQVQAILTHYHELAEALYQASSPEEAQRVLSPITNISEAAQLALVKELSHIHDTAAAAILLTLHELSNLKTIRKEARRSLIRLEEVKIFPERQPSVEQSPAVQLPGANAPRFWKGYVTQSREEGEVQLVLCWEQGLDYTEVQAFTFLIDFWEGGIKEFIPETSTRRNIESRLQELRNRLPGISLIDCTLAEGRRLLAEARSINEWRNTPLHKEYRHYLPIINQLIWNASNVGEDSDRTFINPNLDADEVVGIFVSSWSFGDYGLAYDMLTSGSSLRDEMERQEWLELHRTWANEAHPTRFELGYLREREARTSALWLPNAFGSRTSSSRK